jgi:predicted nuclease of predicted toxin-antitoxin system
MISFLVDQNFDEHIVDGLTRRHPTLEFTHVRDIGMAAAPDPVILEWAAAHGLVLLTYDRKTIPPFAYARVAAGSPMPGIFLISGEMPVGKAKNTVTYFPL